MPHRRARSRHLLLALPLAASLLIAVQKVRKTLPANGWVIHVEEMRFNHDANGCPSRTTNRPGRLLAAEVSFSSQGVVPEGHDVSRETPWVPPWGDRDTITSVSHSSPTSPHQNCRQPGYVCPLDTRIDDTGHRMNLNRQACSHGMRWVDPLTGEKERSE